MSIRKHQKNHADVPCLFIEGSFDIAVPVLLNLSSERRNGIHPVSFTAPGKPSVAGSDMRDFICCCRLASVQAYREENSTTRTSVDDIQNADAFIITLFGKSSDGPGIHI
jgi:hypothetical protein